MIFLSFYLPVCVAAATPPQPSLSTSTGTSRGEHRGKTYFGDFLEATEQFLLASGISSFSLKEQIVSGKNHLGAGRIDCCHGSFFAMQRRYEDYGKRPPSCSYDLVGSTIPLSEKLSVAQRILDEEGIVPLLARFLQDESGKRCYIEIYPFVDGCDGAAYIQGLLERSDSSEELQRTIHQMGLQTGRMLKSENPHADCQPANFFVTGEKKICAIDCRGPLRTEGKTKTETPPALLFLSELSEIIRGQFKKSIVDSTDLKKMTQVYKETFLMCREAFIKGMEEELEGNCLYGQLDIMPSAKEIISITKRLTEVSFKYHSNNHDSDSD